MLELRHVCAGYGGRTVLRDVCLTLPEGRLTALIGPNGGGKTTLLRTAARQLPLLGGEVLLDGRPIGEYVRKEFARAAAFLPQSRSVPEITVQRLVEHGRYPYLGFSRQLTREDKRAVAEAMETAGVSEWAERTLGELSGGERQRAYLAMVLAQQSRLLFLDEPTTYLDIARQFELLELLKTLCQGGRQVLLVLHDLPQALQYADLAVLIHGGAAFAAPPGELMASGRLEQCFGVSLATASDGTVYVKKPL